MSEETETGADYNDGSAATDGNDGMTLGEIVERVLEEDPELLD